MTSKQHQMHVPLDLLQTPATGECVVDKFWMVHPEKGALYVLDESAARYPDSVREVCNSDVRIVERFLQQGHVAMQIPVAYLTHGKRAAAPFREAVLKEMALRRLERTRELA